MKNEKDILYSLYDRTLEYGIHLTPEQVRAVISTNPGLQRDLERFGVDTCTQSYFLTVLTQGLGIDTHQPQGGDTDSYCAAFFTVFEQRAVLAGYRLDKDFVPNKFSPPEGV